MELLSSNIINKLYVASGHVDPPPGAAYADITHNANNKIIFIFFYVCWVYIYKFVVCLPLLLI